MNTVLISMNRSLIGLGLVVTIVLFLFTPSIAEAGSIWSGVGCFGDEQECEFCHLVQLGNSVITWIVTILFVVFGVVLLVAGFNLVTSSGNPAGKNEAKSKLTNALIGIIIVLAAWLIIDTMLKALLSGGQTEIGPWNRIECNVSDITGAAGPDTTFDSIYVPPTGAANNSQTGGNSGFQGTINGGNAGGDVGGNTGGNGGGEPITGAENNSQTGGNSGFQGGVGGETSTGGNAPPELDPDQDGPQ